MRVVELVREYKKAMLDFFIRSENQEDEEIAKNLEVTSYYLVELAKRWGDGRTMPIKKAVKRSEQATQTWLRKRADKSLGKTLQQAKDAINFVASLEAEPPEPDSAPPSPEEQTVAPEADGETTVPEYPDRLDAGEPSPSGPEEPQPDPQQAPRDHGDTTVSEGRDHIT